MAESWKERVLPRGAEGLTGGLMAPGPVAPGAGEVDPAAVDRKRQADAAEAQATVATLGELRQALEPQRQREAAMAAARGEAEATAKRVLSEDRRRQQEADASKKDRLRPFHAFLDALRDLAERGPGGEGEPGRTELVFKLHRLEDTGGPRPQRCFRTQFALNQAEALALGDPGLERRTLDWALRNGEFGRFEWRIQGWAEGEPTLDTTYAVNVDPPAGYVAPPKPQLPEDRPTPPDPLQQLTGVLGVARQFREALGLGSPEAGGKLDAVQVAMIQQAAEAKARFEEGEKHRRELDELRERARRDLEAAEQKGLTQGRAEAERDLRFEYARRIWDLEHAAQPEAEPSLVSEVVGALGGPEAVQGLVGAVIAGVQASRAPTASPLRPPAPRPAPAPALPAMTPAAPTPIPAAGTAPPAPGLPEPTFAQHYDAMATLDHALDLLAEALEARPDQAPEIEALIQRFEAVRAAGLHPGPLAPWWAAWPPLAAACARIIQGLDPDEEGPDDSEGQSLSPGDPPDLKALFIQRLDAGADAAALFQELRARVSPEELAQLQALVGGLPEALLGTLLGAPHHQARLAELRQRLLAA